MVNSLMILLISSLLIFVDRNPASAIYYDSNTGHKNHDNSKTAKILQQNYVNSGNGYNFVYETSDGVIREENAQVKNPGTKEETLVVHGSFSYFGADGLKYTITYIADENGYRPIGEHIPTTE